jgi:hypothetical protein
MLADVFDWKVFSGKKINNPIKDKKILTSGSSTTPKATAPNCPTVKTPGQQVLPMITEISDS